MFNGKTQGRKNKIRKSSFIFLLITLTFLCNHSVQRKTMATESYDLFKDFISNSSNTSNSSNAGSIEVIEIPKAFEIFNMEIEDKYAPVNFKLQSKKMDFVKEDVIKPYIYDEEEMREKVLSYLKDKYEKEASLVDSEEEYKDISINGFKYRYYEGFTHTVKFTGEEEEFSVFIDGTLNYIGDDYGWEKIKKGMEEKVGLLLGDSVIYKSRITYGLLKEGYYPENNAFSHVELYGNKNGDMEGVPEELKGKYLNIFLMKGDDLKLKSYEDLSEDKIPLLMAEGKIIELTNIVDKGDGEKIYKYSRKEIELNDFKIYLGYPYNMENITLELEVDSPSSIMKNSKDFISVAFPLKITMDKKNVKNLPIYIAVDLKRMDTLKKEKDEVGFILTHTRDYTVPVAFTPLKDKMSIEGKEYYLIRTWPKELNYLQLVIKRNE